MRMEDMILVSVDDHLIEPPDMFKRHTPARFAGRMPHQIIDKNGRDNWIVGDRVITNVALNAVAGRRPEEYGLEPTALNQIRKGCYDVHARIDDMNVNGQLAGLNFGTFVGFSGDALNLLKDRDLALAIVRSWNDWHIQDWCGAHPGRFIPLAILPLWDAAACVEEAKRIKAMGCNAITFPPNPSLKGLPSLHDPQWNALWQYCNDDEITVCCHITEATGAAPSEDTPVDAWITNMPVSLYNIASDLTYSQILRNFPNIKFALSEGGAGWVPHFLERIDYVYEHHRFWTHQDFGDKKPSEVFLDHVYTCFIVDKTAIKLRHEAGINNLTWECDYPHADTQWPRCPEHLWKDLEGVPDDEINKITHLNAMRAFNFDPFKSRPREMCTVGALRAEATHVDTSYLQSDGAELAPSSLPDGPIPMREIYRQFPMPGFAADVVEDAPR